MDFNSFISDGEWINGGFEIGVVAPEPPDPPTAGYEYAIDVNGEYAIDKNGEYAEAPIPV